MTPPHVIEWSAVVGGALGAIHAAVTRWRARHTTHHTKE